MEILLLAIYFSFVWLIFFKFKWLPWNIITQVISFTIPIIGMAVLILLLNIFAPSTADVRVIKYVVQIVPQVKGRVIEVPVEGNHHYKKGDVLFRIDPTPYLNEVQVLEAKLSAEEARLNDARSKLVEAFAGGRELAEQLKGAAGNVDKIKAKINLAKRRVEQNQELVSYGAGDKFSLEQAESTIKELQAELSTFQALENQILQKLSARQGGELASIKAARAQEAVAKGQVEAAKAQLAGAQWELNQTTIYAPANGYVINLQLRPGAMTTAFPISPAMSFVEDQYRVIALFHQNELHQVEPGNEAEISLATLPGKIIKAEVESIVWAQGQGQLPVTGSIPQTGLQPALPGRFAVNLKVMENQSELFLAAGAIGDGAIYTNRLGAIHLVRKVIVRVGAYLNFIIPKLH